LSFGFSFALHAAMVGLAVQAERTVAARSPSGASRQLPAVTLRMVPPEPVRPPMQTQTHDRPPQKVEGRASVRAPVPPRRPAEKLTRGEAAPAEGSPLPGRSLPTVERPRWPSDRPALASRTGEASEDGATSSADADTQPPPPTKAAESAPPMPREPTPPEPDSVLQPDPTQPRPDKQPEQEQAATPAAAPAAPPPGPTKPRPPVTDTVYDPDAVDTPISFAKQVRPRRSVMSRRLKETGVVRIRVTVESTGVLAAHRVLPTDASQRLIDAAEEALINSRFHPATRGDQPVRAWRIIEYRFE